MFRKSFSFLLPYFLISLLSCSCFADPSASPAAGIDKTKYITIDEITPGMDATCLTVYQGIEPNIYNLKVVAVIRDIAPNKNAILVMGKDEPFIHTGPVAGCSGSPVYINGRLAGALAFGWTFSKDPLYGVTPIEEMLQVGSYIPEKSQQLGLAPTLDFSKPIDLKSVYRQTIDFRPASSAAGQMSMLPCPIATTLPQTAFAGFSEAFESAGFLPVSGGSSGKLPEFAGTPMKPGGILALPMVYGDIELSAIGTITEVADGKVYAFGHSLLGEGPIDIPIATGYVHTVIASVVRSFKYGQPIEIKGALFADQSSAVVGKIGKKAVVIPMNIKVQRFNDDKTRTYKCQVVSHRHYTPLLVGTCISGAATMLGPLPAEHTIWYKARIGVEGYKPIYMENFSSSVNLEEFLSDTIGAISLIMNNPYDRPPITSLDFEINILPKIEVSHIWNFEISDTKVKPGRTITAKVTLESFLAGNKTYVAQIKIPDDTPPGEYALSAMGHADYRQFVTRLAPYRYTPENMPDLINIINDIANIKRNNLYITLTLPASGITIDKSELPSLPLTKSLLLDNDKRSSSALPVSDWLQQTIPVGSIVLDSRSFTITVEKK